MSLTLDQVLPMAKAGKANFEIARELDVSRFVVTYFCQKHKIKLVKKNRWGRPIGSQRRTTYPPLTASQPEIERYMKAHGL